MTMFVHLSHLNSSKYKRQYGSNFSHFDIVGPEATNFGEIMQNNGHCAVQGHLRSMILVPIENPSATSC